MNPQEFAQKIKAKHPEYNDMDDLELTQKMIQKFPQYKDMVNMEEQNQPEQPVQEQDSIMSAIKDPEKGVAAGSALMNGMMDNLNKVSKFLEPFLKTGAGIVSGPIKAIETGIGVPIRKAQEVIPGGYTGRESWDTPFGEVKNPKDMSVGSNIGNALEIASVVPGVGLATKGAEKIKTAVKGTLEANEAMAPVNALARTAKEFTKAERIDLFSKGKAVVGDLFKKAGFVDDKAIELGTKLKNYITSKDPVENVKNLRTGLYELDNYVERGLTKNNVIFNKGELKNALANSLKDITDIRADQKAVDKLKSGIIDKFMEMVKVGNVKELWKTRKAFDSEIKNKINAFGGSPTLKKELMRSVRNSVQDFIKNKLPKGAVDYDGAMKEMTSMFEAIEILATKAESIYGKSGLDKIAENIADIPFVSLPIKVIKKALIR